ncbi:MAG TPA: phosphoenolpyruvate carboxylase [Actinomycetota bacterium]|nr:phosphoenolpyruvate carboxylase [Actinomycetota bacterium]
MPERRDPAAMPAPLRRDVGLLGRLLGRVLEESGGPPLLADVERLRHATIALRGASGRDREAARAAVVELVAGFDLDRAELVARAFTVYFQLVNLAEEQHRVRTLRERSREGGLVRESFEAAVQEVTAATGDAGLAALLDRLEVMPVLTAHPTEARRRAVVDALLRIGALVARLDDPRLSAAEEADTHRRLLEEITVLWRTGQLRRERPTPLDEVRTVAAVFDATVFQLVPVVYRSLERALVGDAAGTRQPPFRPFLRWGSWVGGDRDGNPNVTAATTIAAMTVQADHVLRGLEAATRRIGRSLTASAASTPPTPALLASLAGDEVAFPGPAVAIRRRSPEEPHRRKLLLVAEKLAATRACLVGEPAAGSTGGPGSSPPDPPDGKAGYRDAAELLADLRLVQGSLAAAGAARLAYGELQQLAWQAETFGFHLASLEVRQHASVHAQALAELAPDAATDAAALDRLATDGWPGPPVNQAHPGGAVAAEALATLRAMAELQGRFGADACRRYVVSFSRSAADLAEVRALARLAVPDGLVLDVVPLFESRADLEAAPEVLDEYVDLPGVAAWLEGRGRRLEVMLGYSDSAKDAGFLAANLALYRAQGTLAAWAGRRGVDLTLFHGRGGALGRGGGPAGRAVRGQAPGSVAGRFKVTEQGEVIFARYGNPAIGHRHLEQVTNAVLGASTPGAMAALRAAEARFLPAAGRMAAASEAAWRALVEGDGFAEFFARVTPIRELGLLQLGSRPARRGGGGDLAGLRAIPWVFAWSQNRCNLPGWYGLGTGLATVAGEPGGTATLQAMHAEWPFFRSLIENAEMSLAKADPLVAEPYLELGGRPDLVAAIREEFRRTRALVLEITGAGRLLGHRAVLRRAVDLRNPYVDALSFLQVRFLAELRAGAPGAHPAEREAGDAARMADLVLLTVNGVAAGLQNTG